MWKLLFPAAFTCSTSWEGSVGPFITAPILFPSCKSRLFQEEGGKETETYELCDKKSKYYIELFTHTFSTEISLEWGVKNSDFSPLETWEISQHIWGKSSPKAARDEFSIWLRKTVTAKQLNLFFPLFQLYRREGRGKASMDTTQG